MTIYMNIFALVVLFAIICFLAKRIAMKQIRQINASLKKIAGGDFGEQVNVRGSQEFEAMSDDMNAIVKTLKYYQSVAKVRMDKEMKFAKVIQEASLPSVYPSYPRRRDFDIYGMERTGKTAGGDFYDFFLMDEGRFGFLIADVSGKGISAVTFMLAAKTMIKNLAEAGMEVDDIFEQTNARLCADNQAGIFLSAWMGILELKTGLLKFANAGHVPPLVKRKGGEFDFLKVQSNLVLAGKSDTHYKKQEIILLPGDEIFLYTNGLADAKDQDQQLFGVQRIVEVLNRNPNEGVEKRCRNMMQEISIFTRNEEQADDMTMLSFRLNYMQTVDSIVVSPDIASTEAVWHFIDLHTRKAGLPKNVITKSKICTDEIYSNILRYSKASKAKVTCVTEKNRLTLVFKDNGVPFDPTTGGELDLTLPVDERMEEGLGIYMAKESATSMSYEYADGVNALTLTFEF